MYLNSTTRLGAASAVQVESSVEWRTSTSPRGGASYVGNVVEGGFRTPGRVLQLRWPSCRRAAAPGW